MDELIALAVTGESYLLHRNGYRILVDGGYNAKKLAEALHATLASSEKLDIVVCTHADRDHAGGLAKLIDLWGGTVGEFWLPGKWADVIPELIRSPRTFIDGLVGELDSLIDEAPDSAFAEAEPEELDKWLSEKRLHEGKREEGADRAEKTDDKQEDFTGYHFPPENAHFGEEPDWMHELREKRQLLEQLGAAAKRAFDSGKRKVRYRQNKRQIGTAIARYWLGLIETAESVRGIAEQAIKHGVLIRWFDYSGFAATRVARGGYKNFLEPLNAVEQAPPPRPELGFVARLSPVNEECLVFLAPPLRGERLGVVFCGDSPLGDGPGYADSFLDSARRLYGPVVATAPHHGSEHNAIAYQHLTEWAEVVLWIRTGGSIRQPGPSFKSIDPVLRLCTHCPQSRLKLQKASIRALHWPRPWMPLIRVDGHDCACA